MTQELILTREMEVGNPAALSACMSIFTERQRAKAIQAAKNRRCGQYRRGR